MEEKHNLGQEESVLLETVTYESAVQAAEELWLFEMGNASELSWEKVKNNWRRVGGEYQQMIRDKLHRFHQPTDVDTEDS